MLKTQIIKKMARNAADQEPIFLILETRETSQQKPRAVKRLMKGITPRERQAEGTSLG